MSTYEYIIWFSNGVILLITAFWISRVSFVMLHASYKLNMPDALLFFSTSREVRPRVREEAMDR